MTTSRPATIPLAFLLLALAIGGCGGATKTVTVDSPPPAATAKSETGAATAPVTNGSVVQLGSFRSPTSNIGCVLLGGVARCDISHRSWTPPARPSSCPSDVDYGQGLQIAASGEAGFVCAGDTTLDPHETALAYGTRTKAGAFTCESARTGVTCKRADGHGFFISIQSYRLF